MRSPPEAGGLAAHAAPGEIKCRAPDGSNGGDGAMRQLPIGVNGADWRRTGLSTRRTIPGGDPGERLAVGGSIRLLVGVHTHHGTIGSLSIPAVGGGVCGSGEDDRWWWS